MKWIIEHEGLVSALSSVGTLAVWIVYLHIFVSSYRHQLHAVLLINRGSEEGWETRCFVSNMSAGPIYVQSVIITVQTTSDTYATPVTDIHDIEAERRAGSFEKTLQGPLHPGQVRDIGAFCHLISRVDAKVDPSDVQAMLIEVVAIYGSEELPVGARRRFVVSKSQGRLRIKGAAIRTTQIRQRRERRQLLHRLERDR